MCKLDKCLPTKSYILGPLIPSLRAFKTTTTKTCTIPRSSLSTYLVLWKGLCLQPLHRALPVVSEQTCGFRVTVWYLSDTWPAHQISVELVIFSTHLILLLIFTVLSPSIVTSYALTHLQIWPSFRSLYPAQHLM